MIIPVRCFTCGKVRPEPPLPAARPRAIAALALALARRPPARSGSGQGTQHDTRRLPPRWPLPLSHRPARSIDPQVIGNKWDTYLDLLQAEYSEG